MNQDTGLLLLTFCIFWATLMYLAFKSKHTRTALSINGVANLAYSSYYTYGLIYSSEGGGGLAWWAYLLFVTGIHWLILVIIIVYLALKNQPKRSYQMVNKENFKLIGLTLDKKTFNAGGQAAVDCGSLWQRFMGESIAGKIPGKVSDNLYAVYFDYDGDRTNPYSFFIGCKVNADAVVPEGLQSIAIPTQNYTVITAKGKMPDCVADAWEDIWKSDINRAYGYDFEEYTILSPDWSDAQVDIYISVK